VEITRRIKDFGTPDAAKRAALEKEFASASEVAAKKVAESLPRIIVAKADDGLPILKAYGIDLVDPNK
jgi:hypothetical protein